MVERGLGRSFLCFSPVNTALNQGRERVNFIRDGCVSAVKTLGTTVLQRGGLRVASTSLGVVGPPLFPLASSPAGTHVVVLTSVLKALLFVVNCFLVVRVLSRALESGVHTRQVAKKAIVNTCPERDGLECEHCGGTVGGVTIERLDATLLPRLGARRRQIVGLLDARRGSKGARITHLVRRC